jgi:hypothetical protein
MDTNNSNINEAFARILQELMSIRADVNHGNVRISSLENNFHRQFAVPPPLNDGDANATAVHQDPAQRSRLLTAPNHRGPRVVDANITGIPKAGLVPRYDAMLQRLHLLQNGSSVAPLTSNALKARRKILHSLAIEITNAIEIMHPSALSWNQLGDDDQRYFSLLLEEKAHSQGLQIYMCKKQWCARSLITQALKALKLRRRRADARNDASIKLVTNYLLLESIISTNLFINY